MNERQIRNDGPHRAPEASTEAPSTIELMNWETIIGAWHDATQRLEQTHAALRGEVARLTDELAVKNRELARKNRLADLGQIASHRPGVKLRLKLLRGQNEMDVTVEVGERGGQRTVPGAS